MKVCYGETLRFLPSHVDTSIDIAISPILFI